MKVNVVNECADNPRACRGIIRAMRFILPFFMSVSLAFAPFSAKLTNSGLCVEKSEAKAVPAVIVGAPAFIESAATAAGLTSGEFVATIVGMSAAGAGMGIATDAGVSMGGSFSHNINSLLDAGDYTPWQDLSEEDQLAWGTQEDYNSAKFNTLMDAFDLGDARDRFYSSGGSFNSDEIAILDRIGRIGSNWSTRASNAYSDISDLITDKGAIYNYLGVLQYDEVDMSECPNYPSNYPQNLYVTNAEKVVLKRTGGNVNLYTNRTVKYVAFRNSDEYRSYFVFMFDKSDFKMAMVVNTNAQPSTWWDSTQGTYNGQSYYRNSSSGAVSGSGDLEFQNILPSGYLDGYNTFKNYIPYLLFEAPITSTSGVNVPSYPTETIPSETPIYYPSEITPTTPWYDYTVQPEEPEEPIVRPDNVYNPNDLTGTQEWRDETASNVMPLQNIKFDKLFPFCLLTDVKDLSEKIADTVTPGEQAEYLKLTIPMAYASNGEGGYNQEDLELDGQPLYDLLIMTKPFNQIMLLFLLVFSLVMFWKSILTGD